MVVDMKPVGVTGLLYIGRADHLLKLENLVLVVFGRSSCLILDWVLLLVGTLTTDRSASLNDMHTFYSYGFSVRSVRRLNGLGSVTSDRFLNLSLDCRCLFRFRLPQVRRHRNRRRTLKPHGRTPLLNIHSNHPFLN